MSQVQISFDPKDPKDKSLCSLLSAYLANPNSSFPQVSTPTSNCSCAQTNGNDSGILALTNVINEKKNEIDSLKDQIKCLEAEKMKQKKDNEELLSMYENENKELKATKTKLEKEHSEEVKELKKNIQELTKKLADYEGFSSDGEGKMYFKIVDKNLSVTNETSAPYIGQKQTGNIIKFQFNCENGRVWEAIQKYDSDLEPFCEIDENMQGGNTIRPVLCGEGTLAWDNLTISKKAHIKIVKQ